VQLHQPEILEKTAALDGRWLIISFAPLSYLQRWVPHFQANFLEPYAEERGIKLPPDPFALSRFAADPNLEVYRTYGLGRNSILKSYGPQILGQYVRWAAEGKPIRMPAQDTLQRGGNFVIGRNGRLTLAHTGRDQSDRPSLDALLAAMAR
jgi:hypothetical protein